MPFCRFAWNVSRNGISSCVFSENRFVSTIYFSCVSPFIELEVLQCCFLNLVEFLLMNLCYFLHRFIYFSISYLFQYKERDSRNYGRYGRVLQVVSLSKKTLSICLFYFETSLKMLLNFCIVLLHSLWEFKYCWYFFHSFNWAHVRSAVLKFLLCLLLHPECHQLFLLGSP